ncbi:hypothetical protein EV356DRAFT_524861 [Viridothelium virens]|uniref:MFS general substrate transporter n=1 Tax=Viridothelium virens TaxID=1048519 RepID=A0A6A6H4S9_VIRVR|nr:hypothetical protein EV356DRAFT_524861 [Viridothelium virens]
MSDSPRSFPKEPVVELEIVVDEELNALGGQVLDASLYKDGAARLKPTRRDGSTVLIPRPNESLDDPLSWSAAEKHTLWLQWNVQQYAVQHAVGNIFTLGVSGIFTILLSDHFGGLPVLLVFQCVILWTTAWAAAATELFLFHDCSSLHGLPSWRCPRWRSRLDQGPFLFHEHSRKINATDLPIILSLYLGPLITAFVTNVTGAWRWSFLIWTIGFLLILALDKTLYNYNFLSHGQQAKSLPQRSCTHLWLTNFYGFTLKGLGFFYFFGITGVTNGWFVGHLVHNAPKARLIIMHPATLLMAVSLLILGFAVQDHCHYMVLAVFASTQCVGIMVATIAVNAYLLHCIPKSLGEGSLATYIQLP